MQPLKITEYDIKNEIKKHIFDERFVIKYFYITHTSVGAIHESPSIEFNSSKVKLNCYWSEFISCKLHLNLN